MWDHCLYIEFDSEKQARSKVLKRLNMLCFCVSVFILAFVALCGILRKWCGTDLPVCITRWGLPVLTSASVGYLTNWLAIQLLFRPYRPVTWLWNMQGMIPKEQQPLAETLAEEIPKNLIPADRITFQIRRSIREYMKDERLQTKMLEYIREESLKDCSSKTASFLAFFLKEDIVWNVLIKKPIRYARVFLQTQITRNGESIVDSLDLPGHIRESILDLKPEQIHKLVERVSGEELGMLQLLGFMLGGFAGLLLVFAQ